MTTPTVTDAEGRELRVGSRVIVDGRDESEVVGWELGYGDSLRVAHSWRSGFHPDEPNPTERTERIGPNTYRCPDLLITDDQEAVASGCQEKSTP